MSDDSEDALVKVADFGLANIKVDYVGAAL